MDTASTGVSLLMVMVMVYGAGSCAMFGGL